MDGIESCKEEGILVSKKPINVYWSDIFQPWSDTDWSFLYPKPKTLFSNLIQERNDPKDTGSFFLCPAVSTKFKKMLVFDFPIDASYNYGYDEVESKIIPTSRNYISASSVRKEALKERPSFEFDLSWLFFSDEDLSVYFTPPFFHNPEYLQYGTVVPGEFNIGSWFRPFKFEMQTWKKEGDIIFKENEPLFYAEFKTDRPIIFHRFVENEKLRKYRNAVVKHKMFVGSFKPLSDKYQKFKDVGYKEKILTEIKKNLVDEEPFRF